MPFLTANTVKSVEYRGEWENFKTEDKIATAASKRSYAIDDYHHANIRAILVGSSAASVNLYGTF